MEGIEPHMEAIPDLGEHTYSILAELGFDEKFVARLARQNAI